MIPVLHKVVIGMPVYNGGATLTPVIESLISQTYKDFVLFISDNCSTDETGEICRSFAARDPRIVYFRQETNVGAEANFDFVLTHSAGEYFMWAAADDVRSPDFILSNINFLEKNRSYVGSTSPTRFEDGEFNSLLMGDETRGEEDPFERIRNFFGAWHANGRFYSLFRRVAIADWRSSSNAYFAADWSLIVSVLRHGKMNRLNDGYVVLGSGGASNRLSIFCRYRNSWIAWFFPFYDFAVHTLSNLNGSKFSVKYDVVRSLLKLNCVAVRSQVIYEFKRRKR